MGGEKPDARRGASVKNICVGLLAHVDAGKTTLAEALLYHTGAIRRAGRVDHGDAYLDTDSMEKKRGITIFSKQAVLTVGDYSITLMDTPGHVDFSAEMERTLSVLDAAILVISGTDGVQAHTMTVWKLLEHYKIPVYLFVNKMDLAGAAKDSLMRRVRAELSPDCIDFSADSRGPAWEESVAVSDEAMMERYLGEGVLRDEDIRQQIAKRRIFPVWFGSALRDFGIAEFIDGLSRYLPAPAPSAEFGARVFKISRDPSGNRLAWIKVTGGVLKSRQTVSDPSAGWEAKVNELRVYSGASFTPVQEFTQGMAGAVTGLDSAWAGEGLGAEKGSVRPVLTPVLVCRMILPDGADPAQMMRRLPELAEEEPDLGIVWDPEAQEIQVQVMGQVQIEVLRNLIAERFGVQVDFGPGKIVYRETITSEVEGVGHFEPLRHYAEVHLLLTPLPRGAGLEFASECSTDQLEINWQRQILQHLREKKHRGVLTGSEITDMKITLVAGRASVKHTEGGDFREATYRAVRQGLMKADSILLEPMYDFVLEIPQESVGRAMSDLQKMDADFSMPDTDGTSAVLRGACPVSTMRNYEREVTVYSRGKGRLMVSFRGYEPCHNADEVILARHYDPEADLENPAGSVFCSHGAGFPVPWNEVPLYMHLPAYVSPEQRRRIVDSGRGGDSAGGSGDGSPGTRGGSAGVPPDAARAGGKDSPLSGTSTAGESGGEAGAVSGRGAKKKGSGTVFTALSEDRELEEIFTRTYGAVKKDAFREKRDDASRARKKAAGSGEKPEDVLLVDGYNVIFAWEREENFTAEGLTAARQALMDILSNYAGLTGETVILVFDAYRVKNYPGEVQKYNNIYVVYTREAETADQYIEKTAAQIPKNRRVTVASSDGIVQVIILGAGAVRMSAAGLLARVQEENRRMRQEYTDKDTSIRHTLFDGVPEEMAEHLERMRLAENPGDPGEPEDSGKPDDPGEPEPPQ